MSYSNPCTSGCTRRAYFSNAGVYYSGLPTGVTDERENYRTINSTAPIIAQFRLSGPSCGNGILETGEDQCTCAADCGSPGAELCTDGVDNDCDGQADCDDGDCAADPACQCGAAGTSCTTASDCCSGKCKGKAGRKTCK